MEADPLPVGCVDHRFPGAAEGSQEFRESRILFGHFPVYYHVCIADKGHYSSRR